MCLYVPKLEKKVKYAKIIQSTYRKALLHSIKQITDDVEVEVGSTKKWTRTKRVNVTK